MKKFHPFIKNFRYFVFIGIICIALILFASSFNQQKKPPKHSSSPTTESTRLIANYETGITVENISSSEVLSSQNFIIQRDKNKSPISFIPLTSKSKKKVTRAPKTGGLYQSPHSKNRVAILPDTVYELATSMNYDNYDYTQVIRNDLIKDQLIALQKQDGCNTNLILK